MANEKKYVKKDFYLNMKVPFSICFYKDSDVDEALLTDDEAIEMLASYLNRDTWSDGRYDFLEEMVEDAIKRMIDGCIHWVLETKFDKISQGKMVSISPSSETRKSILDTQEFKKRCGPHSYIFSHDWHMSIEELPKEDR